MATTGGEALRDTASPDGFASGLMTAASMSVLNLSALVTLATLAVGPLGHAALAAGVAAAVLACVVAGPLVSALVRVPGQITGPSTSIVVIYAALAGDLSHRFTGAMSFGQLWASLSLCVILMGLILWAAARMQLADAIKFLPSPVTAGFVTGIGVVVMWSQLGALLGIESSPAHHSLPQLMALARPGAVLAGLTALAVMWVHRRLKLPGPPTLLALLAGTLAHHLLALVAGPQFVGPTLGSIDIAPAAAHSLQSAWGALGADWLLRIAPHVLPYAAFMALQAIMNAAMAGAAVASITGQRARVHDSLKAQGLANVLCGLLGALPVTTNTMLSLPAARQGAGWKLIAASCVAVLAGALFVDAWLGSLPLSALAGILIATGYGLIDRWAKGLVAQLWHGAAAGSHIVLNLLVVGGVAAAFFVGSAPLALTMGAVLATLLLAINLSRATTFGTHDGRTMRSSRVWPTAQAAWLAEHRDVIAMIRPRGGLFFGTADQVARRLEGIAPNIRYCIVDLSKATTIDATACQMLANSARQLAARNVVVLLTGATADSPRHAELTSLGLSDPPARAWFVDTDHALESVESELLRQHWPDEPIDAAHPWSHTQLTEGLSARELSVLQAVLSARAVEPGDLFRRGDDASSMYVIESGRVEIRIGNVETGGTTRLASLGPGSMFGEISLLTTGHRTADAFCVEPTRMLELSRADMDVIEAREPALHARIMRNLAMLLANRLAIANATFQSHQ